MSVAGEFDAKNVRLSKESREVYILDIYGGHMVFKYEIHCKLANDTHLFFNRKSWQAFLCTKITPFWNQDHKDLKYKCWTTKFWIDGDRPVLAVRLFTEQDNLINAITESFKDQYASLLVDDLINS